MANSTRWGVVVPSCRPDSLAEFKEAWAPLFEKHGVQLFTVYDSPSGWKNIPDFIPRQTDMIRSWGIYRAWKQGCDYTLTLDDDVRPLGDCFAAYESVFSAGAVVSDYVSVGSLTSSGLQMRGFPFRDRHPRDVAVQFGGWCGVLDYDAPTQLAATPGTSTFHDVVIPVPRRAAVTTCIMNAAWKTEYAPIMWQLPLFGGRFNRFGDIWAGLFAKKVLDFEGKAMVINGAASVQHERASDPLKNLERETPGIPVNEHLWDNLEEGDYRTVTDSAFRYFQKFDSEYADHFRKCRDEWMYLFTEERANELQTGWGSVSHPS